MACMIGAMLLSDAEGSEDKVEDVVGRRNSGDFVDWAEGSVEIEKEHFVRTFAATAAFAAVSAAGHHRLIFDDARWLGNRTLARSRRLRLRGAGSRLAGLGCRLRSGRK